MSESVNGVSPAKGNSSVPDATPEATENPAQNEMHDGDASASTPVAEGSGVESAREQAESGEDSDSDNTSAEKSGGTTGVAGSSASPKLPSTSAQTSEGEQRLVPNGPIASEKPERAPASASTSSTAADFEEDEPTSIEVETSPEPASSLTADRLLEGSARAPQSGWRRWLYNVSFGQINVGDSQKVREQRAREHRISTEIGDRARYVAVLSRKGGVGKTTMTTLLGMVLANVRQDRIIAMDANPDRGTLSDRSPGRAQFTARQLVNNRFVVDSFAELSRYVARENSRLHVLASDTDPAVAQAFDEADYRAVTDILGRYYSIVLTDSGTGMVHSVMNGTLNKANAVVLVSGGSVDEARLASETLSWLEAHGRRDLVEKATVVINMGAGHGTLVNISEIERHFKSRVKNVVQIPYDKHLAEGAQIDVDKLAPQTRVAAMDLAALVVDELHD
ncbi:MinD/ParA family ATP-binding protein [Haematomicrobium sanguinis]|uniref:MinD/ParA family ATP-binding protein n=1 Tax=Haematomicrobium sanguinis TaxID=479106 RepID=UPI0009FBC803|nr:MinD/ParA family protein [Haematomicrobium sanguinis]